MQNALKKELEVGALTENHENGALKKKPSEHTNFTVVRMLEPWFPAVNGICMEVWLYLC